jgi:hypothetical protein
MKLLVVQAVLVVLVLINIGISIRILQIIKSVRKNTDQTSMKFELFGERTLYSLDRIVQFMKQLPKEITVKNILSVP